MRRRGLGEFSVLLLTTALISSSFLTTAATASYKIKQGDSLSAIAHRHHTTVAKLMKANHLKATTVLALGRPITIPGQKANAKPHARVASAKHTARMAHVHAAKTAKASSTAHVSAGSASLRSAPESGSHRVALLDTGTSMKVLSRQGKWAKVALSNGTCGFVYRPLLASGAGSAKSAAVASSPQSSEPDRSDSTVIRLAMACRGTHYVRGGTSRGGFDCSGFTRYVYAKYGVSLPHSSAAQAGRGTAVSRGELKAGDLVFFQTNRRGISHVGIYIGNGNFVHAASRGRGVTVDSLDSSYYAPRYRGARRVE